MGNRNAEVPDSPRNPLENPYSAPGHAGESIGRDRPEDARLRWKLPVFTGVGMLVCGIGLSPILHKFYQVIEELDEMAESTGSFFSLRAMDPYVAIAWIVLFACAAAGMAFVRRKGVRRIALVVIVILFFGFLSVLIQGYLANLMSLAKDAGG